LEELSTAQVAVGEMLRHFGINFEYEKIWPNGDHPYFSDVYLPDHKLTIECDGNHHRDQKKADIGKSMYIARNFGVATVRVWNSDVDSGLALQRIREMLGLAIPQTI
jgi:very-short-patch-repair endonuclease